MIVLQHSARLQHLGTYFAPLQRTSESQQFRAQNAYAVSHPSLTRRDWSNQSEPITFGLQCDITESQIHAAADLLVSTGLFAAGYNYVNVGAVHVLDVIRDLNLTSMRKTIATNSKTVAPLARLWLILPSSQLE